MLAALDVVSPSSVRACHKLPTPPQSLTRLSGCNCLLPCSALPCALLLHTDGSKTVKENENPVGTFKENENYSDGK